MAGLELTPALDYDIANINVSVGDGTVDTKANQDRSLDEELSSMAWHFDSFSFVCVTMISDCDGMIGGETALRTATGEAMKVRGPAMVKFPFFFSF